MNIYTDNRSNPFRSHFRHIASRFLLPMLIMLLCLPAGARSAQGEKSETMLMFVGEELDVLTIATRREESAARVPAVARVITRQQILDRGIRTVGEALELVPGFYVAQKEGGSQVYLRGIPGSVLFLYDTVPLGSEVTKSLQSLDQEIQLAMIKRIEIVRGPGSVLWGPDAFAGVVNFVPMDGGDIQGAETGVSAADPGSQVGAYLLAGRQSGGWDTFFSASVRDGQEDDTPANIVRFWQDDETAVPPDQRTGHAEPGPAHYIEGYGRIARGDLVSLSARISDVSRPYTMTDQNSGNAWIETRSVPSGYVKLEGKHDIRFDAAIRFNGSYRWIDPTYEIIDRIVEQKERTAYAEMVVDKTFMAGKGLLTAGLSYRENRVEDAPIWDGYLPDYLGPDNDDLVPLLDQVDYETRLTSIFGQYSHKIGPVDLMAGLRYDDHDVYNSATTYDLAAVWSPARHWALKLLHGTAFRTPYATQLRDSENGIDPEKIINYSAQLSWSLPQTLDTSITGFYNKIDNHVNEDPYAGLSDPNTQRLYGIEADARWRITAAWEVAATVTLMNNSGPDEGYRYIDYWYFDDHGNWVPHYAELSYPYDTGAKQLFNAWLTWRPGERFTLTPILRYIGSRDLGYPRGEAVTTADAVWLVDLGATWHQCLIDNADLSLSIKNLLDRDYEVPGTYSLIEGQPFTAEVTLRLRW